MPLVKKLTFAPLFLMVYAFFCYQLGALLGNPNFIFSFDLGLFEQILVLIMMMLGSSLLFVVFVALSQDWRIVVPVAIVAAILPIVFISGVGGLVFAAGSLLCMLLIFLVINNKLKTYLTFQPTALLSPSVKNLSTLLIICSCLAYFFVINQSVKQNGFQIPDSILDTVLKFSQPADLGVDPTGQTAPTNPLAQFGINQEQIDVLKKNPSLLKERGIDPSLLDSLSNPKAAVNNSAQDSIKKTINTQFQSFIKPYLGIIPYVLAILLFFTLTSLQSLLVFFIYLFVLIIFYILEKSNFITFVKEMREVKKMVV